MQLRSFYSYLLFGGLLAATAAPERISAQPYDTENECELVGLSADPFSLCARVLYETAPIGDNRTLVTVRSKWDASSDGFFGWGVTAYFYAYDGCDFFPFCLNQGSWWGDEGEWTTRTFEADAVIQAGDITGYYSDAYYIQECFPDGSCVAPQFGFGGPMRPVTVPEPSSAMLTVAAMFGMAVALRRRK